jgi:sugar phosphate isomerase/epimerase
MEVQNIYISTTFNQDDSKLKDSLIKCKQYGLNSVELGSNHCYENNYDYLSEFSFQYLVHNYFPIPKKSFVLNISSFDENIRNRSIFHIKQAIDFCREVGAHLYTFHPGFLTDPKGSNYSNQNYDFQWDESQLQNSNHAEAEGLMYNALDEVVEYAKSANIRIAIETEGSLSKKNHLLMQRPEEYENFIARYNPEDIGINLNIGHLNLAVKAFNFNVSDFINLIQEYVLAMELSHNDGVEDQHLPLQLDGWYWDLIQDTRFKNVYKILEFRNTPMSIIVDNIKLIQEQAHAV